MENMPVFVKIDDYENVMKILSSLKNKIESSKETLTRINDLKNQEDSQLETWHTALAEIEDRVHTIGEMMHEPEQF